MMGMVSEIKVKQGDVVHPGDVLLKFEAMKMEVAIASEVAGTISRILVEIGEYVEPKDLLIELTNPS